MKNKEAFVFYTDPIPPALHIQGLVVCKDLCIGLQSEFEKGRSHLADIYKTSILIAN